MPSEASPTFFGAPPVPAVCRKNPFLPPSSYTAVTTPSVVTFWSTSGEVSPVPWIVAIGVMSLAGGLGSTGSTGGSTGSVGLLGSVPGSSAADLVLRGVGAATSKSLALLSVSTPTSLRWTDSVFLVFPAGLPSETVAAPHPTRSTTVPLASISRAMASLPLNVKPFPVASGVGSGSVPPSPFAPCTRKYPLAGIVPERVAEPFPVSVLDRWVTVQPVRSIGASVGL